MLIRAPECWPSPIEGAFAAGAEALHEAMADHGGVARGLDGAGLVVDLGGEEDRAAAGEGPRGQRIEMRLVADPNTLGDAGAAGDLDDVGGRLRRARLLAGDLIDAVVH